MMMSDDNQLYNYQLTKLLGVGFTDDQAYVLIELFTANPTIFASGSDTVPIYNPANILHQVCTVTSGLHHWVKADNERIKGMSICIHCRMIATTSDLPIRV